MDPVEIFRAHHISNFEKKLREITDYKHMTVQIWYAFLSAVKKILMLSLATSQ